MMVATKTMTGMAEVTPTTSQSLVLNLVLGDLIPPDCVVVVVLDVVVVVLDVVIVVSFSELVMPGSPVVEVVARAWLEREV